MIQCVCVCGRLVGTVPSYLSVRKLDDTAKGRAVCVFGPTL